MDHVYVCQNGNGCATWYKAPTRFTGTLVGLRHRRVGWGLPVLGGCFVSNPSPWCSPQDAFVKITRYEGIRSLWSGLPPTL